MKDRKGIYGLHKEGAARGSARTTKGERASISRSGGVAWVGCRIEADAGGRRVIGGCTERWTPEGAGVVTRCRSESEDGGREQEERPSIIARGDAISTKRKRFNTIH